MPQQFVIFNLNDEYFGVSIDHIIEIIRLQEVFKVPNTPPYIEGLINLRGKVFTLLNLRKKFEFPEKELNKEDSKILIIETNSKSFGFIVDAVDEIVKIEDEEIQPPPESTTTLDKKYIKGSAKVQKQLILLLDLEMLVSECQEKALQNQDVITL